MVGVQFDQMTDIIINKVFQFKFRESAEILDEDSINLTEALAAKKLFSKPDDATGDAPIRIPIMCRFTLLALNFLVLHIGL